MSFTRAGSSTPEQLHQNLILSESVLFDDGFRSRPTDQSGCEWFRSPVGYGTLLQIRQVLRLQVATVQLFSAPEVRLYSGSRSCTMESRSRTRLRWQRPFQYDLFRRIDRIGFRDLGVAKPLCARKSVFSRSMALSESTVTASFTCTCRMRWSSALEIQPEVNAIPIAASKPLPDQLSGMPMIPNRKTTSVATITPHLPAQILIHKDDFTIVESDACVLRPLNLLTLIA